MNSNQEPEDNFIDSGSSNIRVENISKSFFGIDVLNNINLDFNSGVLISFTVFFLFYRTLFCEGQCFQYQKFLQ